MKKIFFTAIIPLLLGFSASAQNTPRLLTTYLSVKEALVNSDGQQAVQAIRTFYQTLKSDADFALKSKLLNATEKLNKASGVEKQRTAFKDVSALMWDLVKESDKLEQTIYYQYCPMKKAYWLSKEKEIKNPYYGSAMLSCGKVVEQK